MKEVKYSKTVIKQAMQLAVISVLHNADTWLHSGELSEKDSSYAQEVLTKLVDKIAPNYEGKYANNLTEALHIIQEQLNPNP